MNLIERAAKAATMFKKLGKLTDSSFFSQFFFPSRRNRTNVSPLELQAKYRSSELVYACIKKICDVSLGARIIVQSREPDGSWSEVPDHPLVQLLRRPNPWETGREVRRKDLQSLYTSGLSYLYLTRPRPMAAPVGISVLNPVNVRPEIDASAGTIKHYVFRDDIGNFHIIRPEDLLIRRFADITNPWAGLSPLEVALSTIDADLNQTDFVNAFFESGGVPSGVLTFDRTMSDEQKQAQQKLWQHKYGSDGDLKGQVAVMDQGIKYTPIGIKLDEMAAGENTQILEAKICGVFGVPPILVSAYVGLVNVNQRASVQDALKDFGQNKIVPELNEQMEWLTFCLLAEFEKPDKIAAGRIRVWYDSAEMPSLQEDKDAVHKRARENATARIWTVDEARIETGVDALPNKAGEVMLQPRSIQLLTTGNDPILDSDLLDPEEADPADPDLDPEEDPVNEDDDGNKFQEIPCPKCRGSKASPTASGCSFCKANGWVRLTVSPVKKNGKLEPGSKVYVYDGLQLARKPRGVELVIDLKKMIEDQEAQSQALLELLLRVRRSLIIQALQAAQELDPQTIAQLQLRVTSRLSTQVSEFLAAAYDIGRDQVVADIQAQRDAAKSVLKVQGKDFTGEEARRRIRSLSFSTIARILSEIQSRAINVFLSLFIRRPDLDLEVDAELEEFFSQMREELLGESTAFVEGLARDNTNAAVQTGREDEIAIQVELNGGGVVEYSALLDKNTCEFCREQDGVQAASPEDLVSVPNPDCEGGTRCRCFHVYIEDPGGLEGDLV